MSATTGVTVASIKFYLREGLLPEGARTSATQADYGDAHVRRLRVIRALLDSGASIAATRRVLAALDHPPENPNALLEVAHAAVLPEVGEAGEVGGPGEAGGGEGPGTTAQAGETGEVGGPGETGMPVLAHLGAAEALASRLGWVEGDCDPAVLAGLAQALGRAEAAGFEVPAEVMDAYVGAVRSIADAEIDGIPTTDVADAVRYVVLGTVLSEQIIIAMRRVAEQVASTHRFGRAER